MAIQLFKHNAQAYESTLSMLQETGKAAVVHPTGTGKSFIAFKLCEDNPDKTICWLSPSEYIFETQLENLAEVSDGYKPENIIFYTYAKLMNMTSEELAEIKPDYIVLDEFHRCGAEMWGKGVQSLLDMYKDVPILGLSATAVRYLDNQRDMSDELFDGNVSSEMTLGEAIVRGILNPPKYVLSVFSYQKDLDRYKERVRRAKSKAVRDAAERYLEALRRALEKADGLDVIFDKHMTDRHGKYIVFCSNVEHLYEMQELAPKWFSKVDSAAHYYAAYSDNPETSRAFADFKKDNSEHLKLLFCVDMLNEGVHVEDINGVILLRPTVSPIIYKQQIGRALSASKKNDAVIFDIVLNIENLYSIDSVKEEMQTAISYFNLMGETEEIVNEQFKVTDEVRDCISLFDKLNDTLTASWDLMYECAKSYYEENGNLDVPKRFVTDEGYTLGSWLGTQRLVHEGKTNGILTDTQVKLLDDIGMVWDSSRDITWEKNYSAAKAYFEEHGDLLVNISDNQYHGVTLGRWIAQLRVYRKSGIKSSYITSERIKLLDDIGMIWDVPDYLWERNYHSAVKYHKVYGDLNVPCYYVDEDGVKLGSWLSGIRSDAAGAKTKRASLTDEQKAKLDELGFSWQSKHNNTWEKSFEALKEYKKEFGDLDVPSAYTSNDGCHLGRWLRRQKSIYGKTLSAVRQKKLEELGVIFEVPDAWDQKFELVRDYFLKNGNTNIPSDLVVDGVWIARWLTEQVARLNEKSVGRNNNIKKLSKEQIKKLDSVGIKKNISKADIAWNEQYNYAKAFYEENGNLIVPRRYLAPNGKNLYVWLMCQKSNYQKHKLNKNRAQMLEKIGVVWEDDSWGKGFARSKKYYEEHGNLDVSNRYICEDGYKLGGWISNQRASYQGTGRKKLSNKQIKALNGIDMIWDYEAYNWHAYIDGIKKYIDIHGNTEMPSNFTDESGRNLYSWIYKQRKAYSEGILEDKKIKILKSIGIDLRPYPEIRWDKTYQQAFEYYKKHGDALIPCGYKTENGFGLGVWLYKQKSNVDKLNQNQKEKLRQIGAL